MDKTYLSVGIYKGEPDFRASSVVCDLTVEEMNKIRAMLVVAIGSMEDMFRRAKERENPAASSLITKQMKK